MNIKESFEYFYNKTEIEIPKEIQDYYLEEKNNNSSFVRLFKSQIETLKDGYQPTLSVLISETFAREILKLVYEIPKDVRMDVLFKQISNHSFNGIKNIYLKNNQLYSASTNEVFEEDTEEFILNEIFFSVKDYDFRDNKFNFSLVQSAYEKLSHNDVNIKVILILWGDCGGEGGIIVRGKNIGFNSSYPHNEYNEIHFNGKKYEYPGFLFEEYEKKHKPFLEN